MGDGEKLLTHLNSALKVLIGLDIFPLVPKKKLNFVDQCYLRNVIKICTILGKFTTGNVRKKQSKTTCSSMYSVHEEYTFTITRNDGLTH